MSTTILLTLKNFWFFDRKYFYEIFCSHVHRIQRAVINITEYHCPSIHSFAVNTIYLNTIFLNQSIAYTFNDRITHIRYLLFKKMPFLSFPHPYISYYSFNKFNLCDFLFYTVQTVFTPIIFIYS